MEAEAAIHFEYRHQLLFSARTEIVENLWPMQIEAGEQGHGRTDVDPSTWDVLKRRLHSQKELRKL